MKLSKQVTRRLKAVRELAAALRRPREGLIEKLKEILGEDLPGGSRCFELLADRVLRQMDRLQARDHDKFFAEGAVDNASQQRRQAADAE